jgi:signal transduction histidine kinase
MGFNSILKENISNSLDPELQYSFEAIDNSCLRLIRTIDQLLDMAQLQSGSYKAEFENFNLTELVEGVIKNYKPEANSKNLGLNYINNTKDQQIVSKDKYSVTRILSNLLDNAVKYSNEGDIKVIIDKDEKEKIKVSVIDSGIGISQDYQRKIFSLFSQEQMGYSRKYEGNGLGLALSKKFADLNDISIVVNSIQDEGSTFTIIFN